ncbi:MAG: alpha-L-fucosidase [Chloroflexota bacterium]|nr:alpha-L-fucosidase [Chloroflexota bacterium]
MQFWRRFTFIVSVCLFVTLTSSTLLAQDAPPTDPFADRAVPDWYDDAKLGIFIHWGAYSVPAWAPLTGELDDVLAQGGWEYWFAHNPYAEWYANSMKIEGSDTAIHHAETYGADFAYDDFIPLFNGAVEAWNPAEWAELFADVGARYVVLTTKHHDGFLLWDSATPNPNAPERHASRDIVGELSEAVRAEGMRMGLYYSGGLDWTFNDPTINSFEALIGAIIQDPAYEEYATAQYRELIDRYQPSILWNDLGYPAMADLNGLFEYFYSAIPDGVVNNRFDLIGTMGLHHDFTTPEYAEEEAILLEKWESTRGLGYSFGYNQNDTDENLLSVDELVDSFVDIVSKGGNLLLNIGPNADGTISELQLSRLRGLGYWLDTNGDAIYGSDPWVRAEAQTTAGGRVRFTTREGDLYAILLDALPTLPEHDVVIEGLTVPEGAVITLLGFEGELVYAQDGDNLIVTLTDEICCAAPQPAWTLKISPAPEG